MSDAGSFIRATAGSTASHLVNVFNGMRAVVVVVASRPFSTVCWRQ